MPSRLHSPPHPPLQPPSFLHVLYDHNINLPFSPPASSPAMIAYNAQYNHWQNHPRSYYAPNPYPSPSPPPPPPPTAHKVWILDCKSCGTFLTNRGMKAVLLLRPNVSLYSSDALPVNCSAYTSNPNALRPRSSPRSSSSSQIPPRTCDCLTQTLCCHGCGANVGYMICPRCTSSITATNRATNGHRFVFHSTEISETERHYVLDEPGVIPFEPIRDALSPRALPFIPPPVYASYVGSDISYEEFRPPRSGSSSPSRLSDYLPTPPLEWADPSTLLASDSFPFPRMHNYITPEPYHSSTHTSGSFSHHHPPSGSPSVPSRHPSHLSSRPTSAASVQPSRNSSPPPRVHHSFPFGLPAEQKEQVHPRKLSAGDVLFWHHLARNGEIPGVEDDERARGLNNPPVACGKVSARMDFDR